MHRNGIIHINIFSLGLISGAQSNGSAPILSSNSLHRKVGETVTTLYPRALIYFKGSIIGMVLSSV